LANVTDTVALPQYKKMLSPGGQNTCLSVGASSSSEQGYARQLGLTKSSALSVSTSINTISIVLIQNLILFNRRAFYLHPIVFDGNTYF
jgi:hypothetical protein